MSRQAKVVIGSGILAAISEALLWTMNESYGKLIDNTNLLGIVAFIFHRPGEWISGLLGLTPPGDHGMTQILVIVGALQFFLIYWCTMTVLLRFAPKHSPEPHAPPNGGPAQPVSSSSAGSGPPSVS